MKSITIGGKTLKLLYNAYAMNQIDEQFGSTKGMLERMKEKRTGTIVKMLVIFADGAKIAMGENPDTDEKWLLANMMPKDVAAADIKIGESMEEGLKMETDHGELDDREHDEVLEEIQKKETAEA